MKHTRTETIADLIAVADEGTVFITSDFADCRTDDAIRKTLSRLFESGDLERPIRGVYRKPWFNASLENRRLQVPTR